MRTAAILCLAAAAAPLPAFAQSAVEARVGKLESEMRAVQRKVFPAGAGTYLEPQITAPDEAPLPPRGTPATGALDDLSSRVTSLEGQLATLTGQIEQNGYRLRQLEDAFAAYRKATDAKLAAGVAAPAPASASDDVAEAPAPAKPAAAKPAATAVAGVEKPDTGDAPEDAYMYGYRLWAAKKYPEAEAQLKKVVATYPDHRRASYAQNLLGRSYLDEGKPSLASIAFYDNYKKRPEGERAPDSLYFLGQALMKLNKPADACKVYGELTDVYGAKIDATMKANVAKGRLAAKCK
jgi:TolA-binding protein